MKNRVIRCLGFLAMVICVLACLMRILCVKSENGVSQARNLYNQPADSVDVLFLGSSHVHCNVDPRVLWEQEGIASYILTTAEQPIWNSYYYLKEALKTQSPRLVVVDMYGPARFQENIQEAWLGDNLDGMRISLNKWEAIRASAPSDYLEWFLGFPRYHDRYGKLSAEDFQNFWWDRKEQACWKGFLELQGQSMLTEPDMSHVTQTLPLSEKSQEYFEKIIALCAREQIELVFLTAPYLLEENDQMRYDEIARQCREQGLVFVDYNQTQMYREMNLEFEEDFADHTHLNKTGAVKYSAHLAAWLKANHALPDRRGQEGYESWENQTVMQREF